MYDYVIVGAGSAGCTLAGRLTERSGVRVLLLEVGPTDKKREVHIPIAFSKLFKGAYDWAFYTVKQPHLANRELYWPRGKVLGGSSSINAMIYMRGNRLDYDQWRSLGNVGWGYADVLPYFMKSENQERGASALHGTGGPLNVADLREVNPLSQVYVEAARQFGFRQNDDFNGSQQEGVGLHQVTQKGGKRHSAADGYLKPHLKRPNLTVELGTRVTRILIESGRAVGVRYLRGSQQLDVRSNREVIVCAGAVGSPQLLMLSGIGPGAQLSALGIPVEVDLPGVGQNLQDHPVAGAANRCTKPISLATAGGIGDVLKYLLFQRGPLTSNVAEAGGFTKSHPDLPAPDLQFLFAPAFFFNHGFTRINGHGFSLGAVLVSPQSRGQITLRSPNASDPPDIQPNYLASDSDAKALVEGVKLCRGIIQQRAFDPYRGEELFPGPDVKTDDDIRRFVSRYLETMYHPVGTCKMGSDRLAVVDSDLRVRGIGSLRVIDASIMPTIVRGNTNAPAILIAEKAASILATS